MRFLVMPAALFTIGLAASAHHSDAGLDMESITVVEGTVTGYYFRNPHIYFTVDVPNGHGEMIEWTMQMGSVVTSSRRGWTRDSLAAGDRITVELHASMDGRPYGLVSRVDKEDGAVFDAPYYEPDVTAAAASLDGIWMANSSELVSYPGGFDGFFRAKLELTEAGRLAMESYDPLSAENPESTCRGRPSPAMIVSSNLYPIRISVNEEDETVIIHAQYWDEIRTIHMDGRQHPGPNIRTHSGHSIGHWEGDTLVVDTANFSDHRSPYQIGVPSGAEKHLVERYRLVEGGTRMAVEFTLSDPEYLAAPLTHSRELIYSPHLSFEPFDCDPEAAQRFITD